MWRVALSQRQIWRHVYCLFLVSLTSDGTETFIFNHSVVYRCFCKDSHFTLQRHTTSKHVFKFTCATTLVVWVSDCCWNSDDRHSVLCLNASCVNPDRQWADPPLIRTDSVTNCDMKGLKKIKHSDQALREPWGTNKEMFILVYLFSNSDPTRFLFLKVFFFCQNILVRIFIVTSETLFNFSFSVELTRKMCETEWKTTFTWKTFFGTQCVKNK